MLTLIENGEVYSPRPEGRKSILLAGQQIPKVGQVDRTKLSQAGLDLEVLDAAGCYIVPGLVDPHSHIAGGGGEQSFKSRQPQVTIEQLAGAGITTVVGLLGTDTVTRPLPALLGAARQLQEQGVSAFIYTGGFQVPPPTFTGSIIEDFVMVQQVIGVGEIAISDVRAATPTIQELARLVSEAYMGGSLNGKAGIVNFHTGEGTGKLDVLHQMLDCYEIKPESVYPSHVNRSFELLDDAIKLAKRGSFVDMDTTSEGLGRWLRYYLDNGGPADHLTVSSDSHTPGATPHKYFSEFAASILEYDLALEKVLPFFTLNPATALKLPTKGRVEEQADADLLILDKATLKIKQVFARGKQLVKDGRFVD
jgi:beta-aspartyl-dipeptidase (metallo-type)